LFDDEKIKNGNPNNTGKISQGYFIENICPVMSVEFYFIIDTNKNNPKYNGVYNKVPKKKILIYFKNRHNGKIREIV